MSRKGSYYGRRSRKCVTKREAKELQKKLAVTSEYVKSVAKESAVESTKTPPQAIVEPKPEEHSWVEFTTIEVGKPRKEGDANPFNPNIHG